MIEFINETPLKEPLIFDTHAHYEDNRFDEDRKELFSALHKNGVGGIITCGCDLKSSKAALKMAKENPFVYAAVGMHPGNMENPEELEEIEKLFGTDKCVAVGEIGLDYYWTQDNKPLQKTVFTRQIEKSLEYGLPIIVHDREAHSDTLEILKHYRPRGVVHAFSGSPEMAEEILKLGMYIGIGGVITFKNAKKLPEVVKMLPEDRILLETDAPYLAPVPYRSKTNNSAMIYLIAQKIAELRETKPEHILNLTFKNAKDLFGV